MIHQNNTEIHNNTTLQCVFNFDVKQISYFFYFKSYRINSIQCNVKTIFFISYIILTFYLLFIFPAENKIDSFWLSDPERFKKNISYKYKAKYKDVDFSYI